jgi:hypothetical protein
MADWGTALTYSSVFLPLLNISILLNGLVLIIPTRSTMF